MLDAKFQDHWMSGSEEAVLTFLPYMGIKPLGKLTRKVQKTLFLVNKIFKDNDINNDITSEKNTNKHII